MNTTDSIKKGVDIAISALFAVALFTLSMYINVLGEVSVSLLSIAAIYFVCGVTFSKFYNQAHLLLPFIVITLLLIAFVLFVADGKFAPASLSIGLIISFANGFLTVRMSWRLRIASIITLSVLLLYVAFSVL